MQVVAFVLLISRLQEMRAECVLLAPPGSGNAWHRRQVRFEESVAVNGTHDRAVHGSVVVVGDALKIAITSGKTPIDVAHGRLKVSLGFQSRVPRRNDVCRKDDVLFAEKTGRSSAHLVEGPNRERVHVEIHATITMNQRRAYEIGPCDGRVQLIDEIGERRSARLITKRSVIQTHELDAGELPKSHDVSQLVEWIGMV